MPYTRIIARMTREATSRVHMVCSVKPVTNKTDTVVVRVGRYTSPELTQKEAMDMLTMVKDCGDAAVRPLYPMHGGLIQ